MSDQTRRALRDAVDAHLRDEIGGDVASGSWLLLAETTSLADIDHEATWAWAGGGSLLSRVGLATVWLRQAEDDLR